MAKNNKTTNQVDYDEMKSINAALKRERAKQPKNKNHYKIFRVEKDEKTGDEKKITMYKFWAKDDSEAYEELKKYRKIANKAYTYYFGTTGYYIGNSLDENGNRKSYDDLDEMREAECKAQTFLEKFFSIISYPYFWLCTNIQHCWWKLIDLAYLLKTKHHNNEHWNLDVHMVDDFIFNAKILAEHAHGVPQEFCNKARSILNKNNKKFDLEKSLHENPTSTDAEMKLASELWSKEIQNGILYAKLWKLYKNMGFVDENNPDDVEFAKVWKQTIPYVPGMYNMIDYKRLQILENKYWNSLWNWFKLNGRNLWD